jgi:protein-S-isoprenylcysteine O-methyltransferase Ste14
MPLILTALALFGVVHSYLAGQDVKQGVRRRVGDRAYEGFYRLGYNLLAVVMLAPVGVLLVAQPGNVVWQVESAALALLFNGLRLLGLAALAVALLQIDWRRFAGLAQVAAYFDGRPLPLPDEPLQTGGLYGYVRHPLYVASLLVLWPAPTMTEALLAFNLGTTAYFLLGSLVEERRLVRAFGPAYLAYRARVPWMLPRLRPMTNVTIQPDLIEKQE